MQKALILDYDGLIVDTEWPLFELWCEVFAEHGAELTLTDWLTAVGYHMNFDPRGHLEKQIERKLDWTAMNRRLEEGYRKRIAAQLPLPGVTDLITDGIEQGFRIGVASNSTLEWVEPGLRRLGLAGSISSVQARDTVENPKPHPEVYLKVLQELEAETSGSLAFEDSAPGIESAKAAGLTVIGVPNRLTRHQDLSAADLVLDSLEEFSLSKVFAAPDAI